MAEQIYVAACLAKNDDPINEEKRKSEDVESDARQDYVALKSKVGDDEEVLCSHIYRLFHTGNASKAIAAQYLSELLPNYCKEKHIDNVEFRKLLPAYLVNAIEHVTANPSLQPQDSEPASTDGEENA